MQKRIKAYTLIELLVVMSIISFIVSGSWAAMRYGLKKSRDIQREKSLRMIQTAIEGYYSDRGAYPQCDHRTYTVTAEGYTDNCHLEGIAPAVQDYLDEPFKSPLAGLNDTQGAMGYYHNPTTELYALCTLTEVKHSDNEHMNYYAPPTAATSSGAAGCFCIGPGADEIRCQGLTDVHGTPNEGGGSSANFDQ